MALLAKSSTNRNNDQREVKAGSEAEKYIGSLLQVRWETYDVCSPPFVPLTSSATSLFSQPFITRLELRILLSSDTESRLEIRLEQATFDLSRRPVDSRNRRSSTLRPHHFYVLSYCKLSRHVLDRGLYGQN